MNSLLDSDRDEDVDDRHSRSSYRGSNGGSYGKDREITLGTTVVLAIFFALAVFGAVFFGFGYSMGAKHAAANTGLAVGTSPSGSFSSFKPAPGNPVGSPAKPLTPDATNAAFVTPTPAPTKSPVTKPAAIEGEPATSEPAAVIPAAVLPAAKPGKPATAAVVATPSVQIAGEFMVQVAASSHQEDAETVVSALKRRGYNVAIHTEPQDKFFHVQIGPFANKADAIAMSKKVAADGFNAIVK